MKHVSLNKIRPSALIKVPGLLILGLLAIGFLLFPLAAFAGCSQQAAPKVAAAATNIEPLFGSQCGGNAAVTKNATVTGAPAQTSTQSQTTAATAESAPTPGLLSAIAKCKFVSVPAGKQAVLNNGDIVLAKTATGTPVVGIVIGTQFRALLGDGNGGHAATLAGAKTFNFSLTNATVKLADGTVDSTPDDGNQDAQTASQAAKPAAAATN